MNQLRDQILAGAMAPGSPVVEAQLAAAFGVSRGPLREAIRQLVDEGLLVTVAYTATYVADLSVTDVREIYSIRPALETFAFEQIWDRRGAAFERELRARHDKLLATIDARDERGSIGAELELHATAYEWSGHKLLIAMWQALRGRLQLYWAAHHLAHGRLGPRREAHDSYIDAALGQDLDAMRAEITHHMQRGAVTTEQFVALREGAARKEAIG